MDIVIASDSNFFPGLLSTVASLVWHEQQQPLRIHVLDGGLTPLQWQTLASTVAGLNSRSGLMRHAFDQSQISNFRQKNELGLMTYARLFIPQFVDAPYVVHIDADFLVTKPVSGLLPYMGSEKAVYGVAERGFDISTDCPWGAGQDLSRYTYINAGILLMNLEMWRKERISDRLIAFLQAELGKCRFHDQTAINWVLREQIGLLPREWNIMANTFDAEGAGYVPGTVNLHYASGMKPWKRPLPTLSHRLWWLFARRFAPQACVPNPFWKPRNAVRYVRHRLSQSSVSAEGSLKPWKRFWNDRECL